MNLQPRFAALLGRMLNALGLPGFVREGTYTSETGTEVRVSRGQLFTIVSVNGTDVYFGRLRGRIDGVGSVAGRAKDRP
jgi:hypothetical protein